MKPAYITITFSANPAMIPKSCVIQITAMPRRSRSPLTRSMICAWMVTSSAVVGSSAMRMLGLQANAIAVIAR